VFEPFLVLFGLTAGPSSKNSTDIVILFIQQT